MKRRAKRDWLEKKRLDGCGKLFVSEVIGVESIGYGSDEQIGMDVHLVTDA